MSLIRRILLPALLAVPIWSWLLGSGARQEVKVEEMLSLSSWLGGAFFSIIGILIFCIPVASYLGKTKMKSPAKTVLVVLGGAVGGFFMLSAIGLIIAWSIPFGAFLGSLGLVAGTVTAVVWAFMNMDLLKARELSLG